MINDSYTPVLTVAFKAALDYLTTLDTQPVAAATAPQELLARLQRPLSNEGVDSVTVLQELIADMSGGLHASAGGRFFGWVVGGAVPAALAADWMTATWDQPAVVHATGPAEAIIEEVAGGWLKELLGIPVSASFAFTTGSQLAHVISLAAARNALLDREGWDVEREGLTGSPRIQILTSTEVHGSVERAARLLGFGRSSIERLPTNDSGQLEPDTLAAALAVRTATPTIVVLNAGDLNIGAFDPFADLIPLAHERGAWVHIDGAFGLWVATSDRHRALVAGVEQADSWVTDGHKWLNVPYDSGFAFIADPLAHSRSVSHRSSYVIDIDGWRGQLDWNPEWSRRGRGVPTYAAIREMGRDGIGAMIDRCCDHALALVSSIGNLPGAEVVWLPTINQGLVRFPDSRTGATDADHGTHTDAVIAAINDTGEALFSGTTWRGIRCMRVSVVNWQTDDRDVERAIEAARRVLGDQSGRHTLPAT